jgi:tetratricopeptide (TPR) repeat protein
MDEGMDEGMLAEMAEATPQPETQPRLPRVAAPPSAPASAPAPGLLAVMREVVWPRGVGGEWTARWRNALFALTLLALCLTCIPIQPGASTYLLAATRARAGYRYDEALSFYAHAHAADSSDPRPLCDAGDVYTLQHEYQQAASAYRACAALAPGDGAIWLRLGGALANAHDDAGAVAAWQRAGAAGDFSGYAKLAQRAESLNQLDTAAQWWSRMPQDSELAQGHLGMLALAQGNAAAASAHFFGLIHSESDYAISLRNAGLYLLAARAPTTALDEENIGIALLTLNEPTLALAPLSRAARMAPTDGSARAYYGWTLWLLGQRDAARPQIAAGLRYNSLSPFALFAAGEEEISNGQFAAALAHFQTALEIDTRNPALWSAAGDAALAEADYVTARLSYANAAQYSNDPTYTIALAQFYISHGLGTTDGTAQQAVLKATQRFPQNEQLAFLKGKLDDALGQQDLAYTDFQQAIALDPTDPGPWYYLGTYEAAAGDVIPAVVDLRTALALQPSGAYTAPARKALAAFTGYTL